MFGGDENEPPALTRGLIPGTVLFKSKRRKKLSSFKNTSGARCSFTLLMEIIPGLKEYLNKCIWLCVNKAYHGENLSPKSFHQKFIQFLSDANWPKDKYPFDQEKLAYESCRKYLKLKIAEYSIEKKTGTNQTITTTVVRAFEEVQIDSCILDLTTSVHFEYKGEITHHRLPRMSLFVALDVATDCVLAYRLCCSKSPTEFDLLHLLIDINKEWCPRKLKVPRLQYEAEACLPSSLGNDFTNVGIGTVNLDNAKCHLSKEIQHYICDEIGATLNLGVPAHPKARHNIERIFKRLNQYIHRFSCTTGSYPTDQIKESSANAKNPQIITYSALEDILSVIITSHNVKPQAQLNGHSPLSLLKSHVCNHLVRMNHNIAWNNPNPFIREKRVNVCWTPNGKSAPHINFGDQKYTASNVLTADLIGKKIIIQYDFRDIRVVEALTTSGTKLGQLKAPMTWQRFKHSVDSRRFVKKLIKEHNIRSKDPLGGVMKYLYTHKSLPTEALSLTKLLVDIDCDVLPEKPRTKPKYDLKAKPYSKHPRVPKWKPSMATNWRNHE